MAQRALTIHCSGPTTGWLANEVDQHLPGAGQVRIHVARLEELDGRATRYRSLLDEEERQRLSRFRFDTDQRRFLLGHGMLREVIGQVLGLDARSLVFHRGRHGKPYLAGTLLRFNLSDTKDAVALAFSKEAELGIDLETMARQVDHRAVSQHYFTVDEQADIAAAHEEKRRFLELWTRKEAVLKASGVGIMDDLRTLQVHQDLNELLIRHPEFVAMAAPTYHVRTWHIGDELLLSLATERSIDRVDLIRG